MRNTSILFYILLCLFSVSSCNQQKHQVTLLGKFTVPQEDHPEWTDLFTDKYTITPLETTPESLVGEINKIKKFNGHYYISSAGKSILCFNEKGKFVTSLNKMGQGPEEYLRIEDFDVYEINGKTEIWISDNKSLKIYDANDCTFLNKISYPFIIHKFKCLDNSHILLVTGQNDHSLTLTDKNGNILSEYLKKEIPYLMFRPVQFVKYGSEYLFQLGISNTYIAFDSKTETFNKGLFSNDEVYLSDIQLLELYNTYEMEFIREANKSSYINNIIPLNETFWIQTCYAGKKYITKIEKDGKTTSTEYSYGTFVSTITVGDSENSLLLYLTPDQLLESEKQYTDRDGNEITCQIDDNPCIVEFF